MSHPRWAANKRAERLRASGGKDNQDPRRCSCGAWLALHDQHGRTFCGPCERGHRHEYMDYQGERCPKRTIRCRCMRCTEYRKAK